MNCWQIFYERVHFDVDPPAAGARRLFPPRIKQVHLRDSRIAPSLSLHPLPGLMQQKPCWTGIYRLCLTGCFIKVAFHHLPRPPSPSPAKLRRARWLMLKLMLAVKPVKGEQTARYCPHKAANLDP